MPRHPNDLRQDHGERDDEAIEQLRRGREAWFERELTLAKLLGRIDRQAAYRPARAAKTRELAERFGYDPDRAGELVLLGHALAGEPGLEAALREGRIRWPAARALGLIHRDPTLLRPGDAWLAWATALRIRDLRRHIRTRIESVRQQEQATRSFTAAITARTEEEIALARRLASAKAGQPLTNGQLVRALATTYNDLFDPLRKTPSRRRMPDTATRPWERGIAAETIRTILRRSGGLCEFGPCERDATEFCHLRPHARGSGREANDLVHGCHRHHSDFDAQAIEFLGWSEEGGPTFMVLPTGEILLPKPPPEDPRLPPRPGWLARATRRPGRRGRRKPKAGGSGRVARTGRGGRVRGSGPAGPAAPTGATGAARATVSRSRPDGRAPPEDAPSSRPRSRRNP